MNNKIIFATIAAFILLLLLVTGETRLTVTTYDGKGGVVSEESYKQLAAQSMLGGTLDMIAQAAVPTSEETTYSIFKARVDNPFPGKAKLVEATVYKNSEMMQKEKFDQDVDHTYLFITDKIDMGGNPAQRNTIRINFVLTYKNQTNTQVFEYTYLSLVQCKSDSDCSGEGILCDRGNMARFSRDDKTYCVKTCIEHAQCFENQVCIKGFCGY